MSLTPTISVITPCYNGEKFIAETIESVKKQSYPVIEMIVIDDGSTDNSADIAKNCGGPVRVLSQVNSGESAARNRGISEARGSHLLFLDADDLLHPDAIATLVALINDFSMDVPVMACGTFYDTPETIVSVQKPASSSFFPTIFSQNIAPVHCWLTPTPLARKIGGFLEDLQYFEDWDFWGQLGLAGAQLKTSDFVGCYYRRFEQSQTHLAKSIDRRLGQAVLVDRLINGMIKRRLDLLPTSALPAFWSAWNSIEATLALGATWNQLEPLASTIKELVRVSRTQLSSERLASSIRWIGVRNTYHLHKLFAWKD